MYLVKKTYFRCNLFLLFSGLKIIIILCFLYTRKCNFNQLNQIRKNWLILLKKLANNFLKNIIRQLFAGESHYVVKITKPYCPLKRIYSGMTSLQSIPKFPIQFPSTCISTSCFFPSTPLPRGDHFFFFLDSPKKCSCPFTFLSIEPNFQPLIVQYVTLCPGVVLYDTSSVCKLVIKGTVA